METFRPMNYGVVACDALGGDVSCDELWVVPCDPCGEVRGSVSCNGPGGHVPYGLRDVAEGGLDVGLQPCGHVPHAIRDVA